VFRPNKLLLFFSLSLVLLLAYPSLFAQEESITITTYYPSPYGSYNELYVASKLGIGTTSPTEELEVGGLSQGYIALSGHLSGYAEKTYPTLKTNGACLYFDAQGTYTGYICYNGGFTDQSDERSKTNITTVGNALDKLSQIKGVTFNWKDGRDNERHMGVLAQDVEKVAPELVSQPEGIDTKGVFYGGLNALTIEAIKELKEKVERLEAKLMLEGVREE